MSVVNKIDKYISENSGNRKVYKVELRADGKWIVVDDHGIEIDGPFTKRTDAFKMADELEADLN